MEQVLITINADRSEIYFGSADSEREMRIIEGSENYRLLLANGQGWLIVAGRDAEGIVTKLARIMGLCPHGGETLPRLVLVRGEENASEAKRRFQASGGHEGDSRSKWTVRDLGGLFLWSHPEAIDLICDLGPAEVYEEETTGMVRCLSPIYHEAVLSGGLHLHAALLEYRGNGVLIAASSGKGKSTCCSRVNSPWRPICDDNVLVVIGEDGRFYAHPLPTWSEFFDRVSERTWRVESYLPLSAIFFLEQDMKNKTLSIGRGHAVVLLTEFSTQFFNIYSTSREETEKRTYNKLVFQNACRLADAVPSYILQASIEGWFWKEMEQVLPPFGRKNLDDKVTCQATMNRLSTYG